MSGLGGETTEGERERERERKIKECIYCCYILLHCESAVVSKGFDDNVEGAEPSRP